MKTVAAVSRLTYVGSLIVVKIDSKKAEDGSRVYFGMLLIVVKIDSKKAEDGSQVYFGVWLIVVKVDSRKSEDGPQVYFGLPSTVREQQKLQLQAGAAGTKKPTQMTAGSLALNTDDSLQIATLVCSTKLTHNGV